MGHSWENVTWQNRAPMPMGEILTCSFLLCSMPACQSPLQSQGLHQGQRPHQPREDREKVVKTNKTKLKNTVHGLKNTVYVFGFS